MQILIHCRIFVTCAFVCGGAVVVGRPLAAQTGDLHLGDIARVSATTPALDRFVGRVVALTDDSLTLQPDNSGPSIAIPRAALTSAERRLPNASRAKHTLAGAGLGAAGGVVPKRLPLASWRSAFCMPLVVEAQGHNHNSLSAAIASCAPLVVRRASVLFIAEGHKNH